MSWLYEPHPAPSQRCVQWKTSAECWYCRLCNKCANKDHVKAQKHLNNLSYYGDVACHGDDAAFVPGPVRAQLALPPPSPQLQPKHVEPQSPLSQQSNVPGMVLPSWDPWEDTLTDLTLQLEKPVQSRSARASPEASALQMTPSASGLGIDSCSEPDVHPPHQQVTLVQQHMPWSSNLPSLRPPPPPTHAPLLEQRIAQMQSQLTSIVEKYDTIIAKLDGCRCRQ